MPRAHSFTAMNLLVKSMVCIALLLSSCQAVFRSEHYGLFNIINEINEQAPSRETDIVLRDYSHFSPMDLQCSESACTWTLPNGTVKQVRVEEVAYVRFFVPHRSRPTAIAAGLGLGALAGLATAEQRFVEQGGPGNRPEYGTGAALGAGLGFLVGALLGSTEVTDGHVVYMLSPEDRYLTHSRSLPRLFTAQTQTQTIMRSSTSRPSQLNIEQKLRSFRERMQQQLGFDTTFWNQFDSLQQFQSDTTIIRSWRRP